MSVRPFTIAIPPAAVADLRQRLTQPRWPQDISGAGWRYGTNPAYLQTLIAYWRDTFDWEHQQHALNAFPHFRAQVDGHDIHFIHARGHGTQPLPIILTHGWPSSFIEMLPLLPLLTDPGRFGGDPADAFDVIIPSYPGFTFSAAPAGGTLAATQVASLWDKLMVEVLGYEHYGAHGGDIGGGVTNRLGRYHPEHVVGIHLLGVPQPAYQGPDAPPLSERERHYFAAIDHWDQEDGAYAHMQQTRPQTLAYGLADSPVGLAAWLVEKFREWSDCDGDVERRFTKDVLLTNISLYWYTQTITPSFGPYFGYVQPERLKQGERLPVPVGIALFPKNIDHPPRELAERVYDLRQWTEMPRGGHFPALEEPELLTADLRSFFRPLRG